MCRFQRVRWLFGRRRLRSTQDRLNSGPQGADGCGMIPAMDEFKATVDSLGNWSLSALDGVREIRIFADRVDNTARMEICLEQDSWSARERVIDGMIEIREMFFDDFSISYTFGEASEGLTPSDRAEFLVYA